MHGSASPSLGKARPAHLADRDILPHEHGPAALMRQAMVKNRPRPLTEDDPEWLEYCRRLKARGKAHDEDL